MKIIDKKSFSFLFQKEINHSNGGVLIPLRNKSYSVTALTGSYL